MFRRRKKKGASDRFLEDFGRPFYDGFARGVAQRTLGVATSNEIRAEAGLGPCEDDGTMQNCKVCGAPGQPLKCRYCRHWRETPKKARVVVGPPAGFSPIYGEFVAPTYMVDNYRPYVGGLRRLVEHGVVPERYFADLAGQGVRG